MRQISSRARLFKRVVVRRWSKFFFQVRVDACDGGFSLLEIVVALFLATMLCAACLQLLLLLMNAQSRIATSADDDGALSSITRVVREDVHAGRQAAVAFGNLNVTLVSGEQYRYFVNYNGQFIRVRAGGGTEVIASGVQSVVAMVNGTEVELDVALISGGTGVVDACTSSALLN